MKTTTPREHLFFLLNRTREEMLRDQARFLAIPEDCRISRDITCKMAEQEVFRAQGMITLAFWMEVIDAKEFDQMHRAVREEFNKLFNPSAVIA